jgi:plasmid stabilization system protein ParE
MSKPVIWSPQSEQDFSSVLDYLSQHWESKVALKFIDITEVMVRQISINPKQFPVIHKTRKIRKCVISKHNSLFYRERKDFVDILRIYDNRQDPRKLEFL